MTASTLTSAPARKTPTRHVAVNPRRAAWTRRAPLLPALIFLIIVTQLPFVATLVISLLRWNALEPQNRGWAGLSNYKEVFTDSRLRDSVVTTIILTVTVVLASVLIGLGVALLLDRTFFGRGIVRTLMIAPFLIVPVAAALLFKHGIYNPVYGLLNGTLTGIWDLFGASNPPQPDWLTIHPTMAVEAELIWQWTPFMMLILLAGLQSRDGEVMEAAYVDGASNWHTSGGLGTANLPYTIYETFYAAHDYGLASAQGVVVVAGSLIIATFALRVVSSLFQEEVGR